MTRTAMSAQQQQQALGFHRAALGVAPDADAHALQQAFRQASKSAHPDAGGSAVSLTIRCPLLCDVF